MADYNEILDTECEPDAPVTSSLMYALRDNPEAAAEGSTGAPVIAAGWHPYNMTNVGDGATGIIYNGTTTSTITTPDFENGYEYRIVFNDLSTSSASADLQVSLWMESAGVYSTVYTVTSFGATNSELGGFFEVLLPRMSRKIHNGSLSANPVLGSNFGIAEDTIGKFWYQTRTTADKVLRVRLISSAGSFDAGQAYLYRRRDYTTG